MPLHMHTAPTVADQQREIYERFLPFVDVLVFRLWGSVHDRF